MHEEESAKTSHSCFSESRRLGGLYSQNRAPGRWKCALLGAVLLSASSVMGQTDAREIVERSLQRITADWNASPDYESSERDQEPHGGSKTFDDLMVAGSPYQRLVAVNDKPLSQSDQKEQQSKLEETIKQRRSESPEQRSQRIANYQKSRERDHLFLEQLSKAFKFKLIGQRKLGDDVVYVLRAAPRPDYKPPNREAEVLKGMRGMLWIDKKTYQWVKVEASVTRPVRIEGFVAEVEPGTHFELDRMPVGDDIWLPKHYVMKARAKVFLLFNHNSGEDDTYFNYRKIPPSQEMSPSH